MPGPYIAVNGLNFAPEAGDLAFEASTVIPSIHAEKYHAAISDPAHFYRYYSFPSMEEPESYLLFIDAFVRQNPYSVLFAIIDRTSPDPDHPEWGGKLAGTIALLNYSPTNLSVEIGMRTHVATHAVGTLLKYCFTMPYASQSESGLGLRRTCCTHGLKREGTLKWTWVLPVGKVLGKMPRKNDLLEGRGRDTAVLATSWEDWKDGAREVVTLQMVRME
ncbi:hypothetical protein EDB19DRAFT_2028412 [Suillus lakei]|nr:hypothetical protein EDB19DRAFT_2028412 [Suillus lakei]